MFWQKKLLWERVLWLWFFGVILTAVWHGGGLRSIPHTVAGLSLIGLFIPCFYRWAIKGMQAMGGWKWPLIGFWGWSWAAYFLSSAPLVGLDEMTRMNLGILGGVLFWGRLNDKDLESNNLRFLRIGFSGLWLIALLGGLWGLAGYVRHPFNRLAGFFGSMGSLNEYYPNAWGDFLIMVMPLGVWLWIEAEKWLNQKHKGQAPTMKLIGLRTFFVVANGGLLGTLLLSYSRGSMIMWGITIALIILATVWIGRKKISWLGTILGITALVGLLVFGAANEWRRANDFHVQTLTQKVTMESHEGVASVTERSHFFVVSKDLILERPLFGFGPYSFRFVFPQYQKHFLAASDHPHNVVLKYGVERGLAAALMFVIFGIGIGWIGLRKAIRKEQYSLLVAFLLAGIIGLVSHNLIDFNLNFVSNSLVFWMMVGVVGGLSSTIKEPKAEGKHWLQKWFIGLVIALMAGSSVVANVHESYWGLELLKARRLDTFVPEYDFENSNYDRSEMGRFQKSDLEQRKHYQKSLNQWDAERAPIDLMRNFLRQAITQSDEAKKNKTLTAAANLAEKYALANPYHTEIWYYWGEILRQKGETEMAREKFDYSIQLNGKNDLRYYLGYLRSFNSLEEVPEQRKTEISRLVKNYLINLKNNHHYTVLTTNPRSAYEIAEILGLPEEEEEIQKLFLLEMDKLFDPSKYFENGEEVKDL